MKMKNNGSLLGKEIGLDSESGFDLKSFYEQNREAISEWNARDKVIFHLFGLGLSSQSIEEVRAKDVDVFEDEVIIHLKNDRIIVVDQIIISDFKSYANETDYIIEFNAGRKSKHKLRQTPYFIRPVAIGKYSEKIENPLKVIKFALKKVGVSKNII